MSAATNKLAVFIDGANLYATAKTLGFDIDYKRLLREFQSRGNLVRAFYYTAIIEDQEYSSIRPLIDWLDYNGYTVVTKATKEFTDASGRRKVKGNMDIELAVDAMELAGHVDQIVLFSGDGDFRSLVEAVQRRGVRVTVISTISSQPPMIADELRRQADVFLPISSSYSPKSAEIRRSARLRGSRENPASRGRTRRSSCIGAPLPRAATKTTSRKSKGSERTSAHALPAFSGSSSAEPGRDCPLCPRLVAYRLDNRARHPDWFNGPVASFGDRDARLLIVGLAPGVQGANRTGRPFTGDYAGDLLYATLLDHGFAKGTYRASPDDGLTLIDCRISNGVRCVPPQNKPLPIEINTCRQFLAATLDEMPNLRAIVALGHIAHVTVLKVLGVRAVAAPFGHGAVHGAVHRANTLSLYDSYHCSRYNTNTRVLTPEMFSAVFARVRADLDKG